MKEPFSFVFCVSLVKWLTMDMMRTASIMTRDESLEFNSSVLVCHLDTAQSLVLDVALIHVRVGAHNIKNAAVRTL